MNRVVLGSALVLIAGCANAHVGFAANDLYAGMFHPLLHLSTLLPLLAASIWIAAQNPGPSLKWIMGALLLATLAGALLGLAELPAYPSDILLLGLGVLFGGLAALARPLSLVFIILIFALLGLLEGYDNIAPDRSGIGDPLLYGAGLLLAIGLVPLHSFSLLAGRQALWLRTGIRVIGSWIAAASALVLALTYLPSGTAA